MNSLVDTGNEALDFRRSSLVVSTILYLLVLVLRFMIGFGYFTSSFNVQTPAILESLSNRPHLTLDLQQPVFGAFREQTASRLLHKLLISTKIAKGMEFAEGIPEGLRTATRKTVLALNHAHPQILAQPRMPTRLGLAALAAKEKMTKVANSKKKIDIAKVSGKQPRLTVFGAVALGKLSGEVIGDVTLARAKNYRFDNA